MLKDIGIEWPEKNLRDNPDSPLSEPGGSLWALSGLADGNKNPLGDKGLELPFYRFSERSGSTTVPMPSAKLQDATSSSPTSSHLDDEVSRSIFPSSDFSPRSETSTAPPKPAEASQPSGTSTAPPKPPSPCGNHPCPPIWSTKVDPESEKPELVDSTLAWPQIRAFLRTQDAKDLFWRTELIDENVGNRLLLEKFRSRFSERSPSVWNKLIDDPLNPGLKRNLLPKGGWQNLGLPEDRITCPVCTRLDLKITDSEKIVTKN